ncbi:MAG: glycoside hydrolase family 15 protein [Thermomicrobiales bacterium]
MTDLYQRSIDLILANQSPSGAYVASPTFPTYRYSWFRDGAYIAHAMDLVGERASARRFYDWALGAVAARTEQTKRAIAAAVHGVPPAELLLHTRYTLGGAVGEDEWPNFQLDGFGTLLWGVSEHLSAENETLPDAWRGPVELVARYLMALWRHPCYDCWEEFGDRVHTATLAALYGGLRAASRLLDADAPRHAAEEIRRFVLVECVADGCLCKSVGNAAVDANLLHVATPYRLLEPHDPIMRATVDQIEADLRRDGGVRRYADDSYYGGGEWVLLTAYLGWHYVDRGEPERATPLLAWIERQADPDGHLPEQVAVNLNHPHMLPVWNDQWGTSARPLLWSHAAYVTLVEHLEHASFVGAGSAPTNRVP